MIFWEVAALTWRGRSVCARLFILKKAEKEKINYEGSRVNQVKAFLD